VKKTTIYLVRHGEVFNPYHIIYGRLPGFKLSERGRFQAGEIARWFKHKNISLVITSPMLRAKQTAEIISAGKLPVKVSGLINEANYIRWEGMKANERPTNELMSYIKTPQLINLGETLDDIAKRMENIILKTIRKYPGKNIVMVSHADPIIAIRLFLENKPLKDANKICLKNASISTLTFDNEGKYLDSMYTEVTDARKDMP
jgi:broad specificity phosphatase PhoE